MEIHVLGPLELRSEERVVPLGGAKQRTLFALLVAARGRVVPVTSIIDELWADQPPARALVSVQSYVANLRRALDPGRRRASTTGRLRTGPSGYALDLHGVTVDAHEFEADIGRTRRVSDPAGVVEQLTGALARWRGPAYAAEAAVSAALAVEAVRLEEIRLGAVEERFRALLELGAAAETVADLEPHVAAYPLRERGWALLVVALYRAQRQGEALAALRRARQVLADELGVDPGPELQALERDVLAQADSLLGPAPTPPQPESRDESGLVGREAELGRLVGLLTAAAEGRGGVALVTGEAGIGKTALVESLGRTATAMGLRLADAGCLEDTSVPGLWPWRRILTQLAGAAADPLHPAADIDSVTFELAQRVEEALAAAPTLLVVEDVHWADVDTARLLQLVLPTVARHPVALVLTLREPGAEVPGQLLGAVARAAPLRVHLAGLSVPEVARLVIRSGLPAEEAEDRARELVTRTSGNPFLVGELLSSSETVPAGVAEMVRERSRRLPARAGHALQLAALVGTAPDLDLVVRAAGLPDDESDTVIDTLLLSGLLVGTADGGVRFSHALVRDALAEGLTEPVRRSLHAQVAVALEALPATERESRAAELAHHHLAAGREHARAAWTWAARAAERAAETAAREDAVRWLERALTTLATDPAASIADRHQLRVDLVRALRRSGRDRQAWEVARSCATDALDRNDAAAAAEAVAAVVGDAVWRWRPYAEVDPTAVALLTRITTRLPEERATERALLLAALAVEQPYDRASTEAAKVTGLAAIEAAESLDDDAASRVLGLAHMAMERPGMLETRTLAADTMVLRAGWARGPAAARALLFRGRDRLEAGRVAEALSDYRHAGEIARERTAVPVLVALAWARAALAVGRGAFAESERATEAAVGLHAPTTLTGADLLPLVLEANRHTLRGTLAEATGLLGALAAGTGLTLVREWHALALLRAGQPEAAREVIGDWEVQPPLAQDITWSLHLWVRAQLWAELAPPGQLASLRKTLRPFHDRMVVVGTGSGFGGSLAWPAGLVAAAAGDLAAADGLLASAVERDRTAGFDACAVHAATALTAVRRAQGRGTRADPVTSWAAGRAVALGITLPADARLGP